VLVIPAKVKAINKKTRELTLVSPDGKLAKIKCGPDVRDFEQIRVGDEVKTTLLESVEVLVTEAAQPTGEQVTEVNRAPVGSKPSFEVIDAIEINALIMAIDYKTREMTIKEPDGRVLKMKAGPDVEHLDKIKVGDSVVTRFTEALSIEVSKAKAGSKTKAKAKKK
jgi:predicted cupin superfamily sugar epimerase